MKSQTRSILEELNNILPEKDKIQILESRGNNLIASAINLLENINNYFGEEAASEMERRLINSIRNKSSLKFSRGLRKINEESCKSKN